MYISDMCKLIGSVLEFSLTEMTGVGLETRVTVDVTLQTELVTEGSGAVSREGTLEPFHRVGLMNRLVTFEVELTLKLLITLITPDLFSLTVAADMFFKDGGAPAFHATD